MRRSPVARARCFVKEGGLTMRRRGDLPEPGVFVSLSVFAVRNYEIISACSASSEQ